MSIQVPVCIIGCGPIGLAGALLLAKFGVGSLIIERRGGVNTHPRSRFVDTNTMELMRFLGVEKEVEETGLGPDWTACNRWFNALTGNEIAAIPSPTFHTVPRTTSPTLPVMTCQDYVENVLLGQVFKSDLIELRYRTEAVELQESGNGVQVVIKDLEKDVEARVQAQYVLGTDGPHSFAREAIGSRMQANPRAQYSQDVIFAADLSEFVGGRKGGLLYCLTPSGVLVFQPLNGVTRWRCQIFKPDPDLLSDEETIARIREAVGDAHEVPIAITSKGMWQPTPGCVDRLHSKRVFLAGDAAHISLPTGGMGNNIGFAGIRNLAWKMAFVLKGWAAPDILDTYQVEHRPLALERIGVGVKTTECMASFIAAYYSGGDIEPGVKLTRQYGDHDGVLLGFELKSPLIAENRTPPLWAHNPTIDFVPCIRAGRRAPHIWVDEARNQSVLDWFGTQYVLVVGSHVSGARWKGAVSEISVDFPMELRKFEQAGHDIYDANGLALVRPDGIIADCWQDGSVAQGEEGARLMSCLPWRTMPA